MSKTKDVVDCLRRVHRAIVKLEPGPADPLSKLLRDVESVLAKPAIVDVIERRHSMMSELMYQEQRFLENRARRAANQPRRAEVPSEVAPAVSLLSGVPIASDDLLDRLQRGEFEYVTQGDLRAIAFELRACRDASEPSPESVAEMPEITPDQVLLGQGLLRARRAAALRFSRIQLLNTGEAGTESAAILLRQLAEEYEDGEYLAPAERSTDAPTRG